MPEKKTVKKARKALRAGKKPSTAAGEFVREEIEHVREGKHGARSTKQLIAIGLSKARRAGVPLAAPKKGTTSSRTRKTAKRDLAVGKKKTKTGAAATGKSKAAKTSRRRARASTAALKRQGRKAASKASLSRQAKRASAKRRARTAKR
jgi:hypothetical protein